MDSTGPSFHNCYRELVLNSKVPIILREPLNWELSEWGLTDWSNIFKNNSLGFRCGMKECKKTPLWEGQCETKFCTFEDFIEFSSNEEATKSEWRYFDYKHIAEYFNNEIDDVFQTLSWKNVGFPERDAKSSTLWIGSPGAHTPCHVDTYGCNLVVQIYGRKRWILFPFSEICNLNPTRVPYEESSIYSNINFSCFHSLKDKLFENCYMVDLNPGDVLVIPPKWWHYVENSSTAISINTWVPHRDDDKWRIQEGLVRYFVSSVVSNIPEEIKRVILNPNECDIEDSSTHLSILRFCKKKEKQQQTLKEIVTKNHYQLYHNESHKHEYRIVPTITGDSLKDAIKKNSCCLANEIEDIPIDENVLDITSLINAFCHPNTISEIGNKFLNT